MAPIKVVKQKVVKEAEVSKYLTQGWIFVAQLKSGDIIIEKALSPEKTTDLVVEQIKKPLKA